jgi:hypothetical protein
MLSEERRCCLRRGDVVSRRRMSSEERRCCLAKKGSLVRELREGELP